MKGKVYKTVVRPVLFYGTEMWPSKKAHEKRLGVAEMRMLRWMCGVTKKDKIRNERIRGTVKIVALSKKVQKRRLQWYGHVMKNMWENKYWQSKWKGIEREEDQGEDGLTTSRTTLEKKELTREDTQDRVRWRRTVKNVDPV